MFCNAVIFLLIVTVFKQVTHASVCLSCTDIDDPRDCTHVTKCSSHEACYVHRYVTDTGRVTFDLGCRDTLQCGNPKALLPGYLSICSDCCPGDLCQPSLCSSKSYDVSMGPLCYRCPYLGIGTFCNTISQCGRDEVCVEHLASDSTHTTQMHTQTGCFNANACNAASHIIGRRDLQSRDKQYVIQSRDKDDLVVRNSESDVMGLRIPRFLVNGVSHQCFFCCPKNLCNFNCGNITTQDINECQSSPCVHGTCFDKIGTYKCTCHTGYSGQNCNKDTNDCSSNPCQHGTCSDKVGGYMCTCNTGYEGQNCDHDVDDCANTACIHGTCIDLLGGYQCNCYTGYTGQVCDQVLSACHTNPCQHGTCTDLGGSNYKCTCNSGYIGQNCDTQDRCKLTNPCRNGTCHVTTGGVYCICNNGYTGTLCDTDINECASSPCVHGHCLDRIAGYQCQCNPAYAGQNCDQLLVIRDCKDVKDQGIVSPSHDDIYLIDIGGSPVSIKCDLHTDNGGWTVIMNRNDGSLDFENKDSTDYNIGFGDVRYNFWEGLEDMHTLTSDGRRYQLRVEMTDASGQNYYETYDDFHIGASKKFELHVGAASGTAGDSLRGHNGLGFTTTDVDQDTNPANCADYLGGGWWFHGCYDSCLTCPYATPGSDECRSMSWNTIKYCVALKTAKMMIRPM